MAKLTKEDFTVDEDGDYHAGSHWIMIYLTRCGINARVASSDWYDEDAGRRTTVDSASGFGTLDEAMQWGVDCVNAIPLRLACAALEIAFEAMAELMPYIAPFVAAARAEAALAEREACAAEREGFAKRAIEAADLLDAAGARIGELTAERDFAQVMIDELQSDLVLVAGERNAAKAEAATAALAARADVFEECAQIVDKLAARSFGEQRAEAERLAANIRARKDGAT